jgi:hypothetical protein
MPFTFDTAPDPILDSPRIQDVVMHAMMTVALMPKAARDDSNGAVWNALRHWHLATEIAPPDRLVYVRRYALRSTRDDFGKLWIGVRLNGRHYRLTARYSAPSRNPHVPVLLRNAGFPVTREVEHYVSAIKTSEWAARGGARASRPGRPMSGTGNEAQVREAEPFDPYNLQRDDDAQEDDENAIENYGRIVNDGYGVETAL